MGVTQRDLPEAQIRDRGWAGQSLSLGKGHAFCAQQSIFIDGVGPWPDPTGQPCEWTVSKVDLPAPGEPPVLTDAHRADRLSPPGLPEVQIHERKKGSLFQTPRPGVVCYTARESWNSCWRHFTPEAPFPDLSCVLRLPEACHGEGTVSRVSVTAKEGRHRAETATPPAQPAGQRRKL